MKKQISNVVIGTMIVTGLGLALPFSSLRKSIPVFDYTAKIVDDVNLHIKTTNNVNIAQAVDELIQSADSYAEVKAIISGAPKIVVQKGSDVANSDSGIPANVQSPKGSGAIYVADNNPPLFVHSGNQTVTNSAVVDKTSYRVNMTSSSLVNNRNSRLIAMSGSASSENAAAQASVRQMAGGAPPPSEDEIVPPIGTLPVGDGSGFFMLLMVLFGVFKVRLYKFAWH